jgi:hypothetical protein
MFTVKVLRLAAWLLGSFAVLSGLMNVLGFIPHSNEMPAWTTRLASSLPSIVGGLVLLAPMSRFLSGRRYLLLSVAYGILVFAVTILAAQGISAYVRGERHWLIVLVSMLFVAVPFANALLLWWLHRRARRMPNNAIHATCEDARA